VDGGPKGAEGGKETVVFPAENERKYAAGSVFFFFPGKKMMQGITKNKAPSSSFSVQTNFFNF
jgi:hypothetical protein